MRWILVAMAASCGPSSHPLPTETDSDTDPDASIELGDWAFTHDLQDPVTGFSGSGVAFHQVEPLLVAVGTKGGPSSCTTPQEANLRIWAIDVELGTLDSVRSALAPRGPTMHVQTVGDLNGDGFNDVATSRGVMYGPFALPWESVHLVPTDWAGLEVQACDANRDGLPDLCGAHGVGLGPIDGVPETTWLPGAEFWPPADSSESLVIGDSEGQTVAYLARPPFHPADHIVRVPLGQPGELDLGTYDTWMLPDGFQLEAMAILPTGGDDTLVVCGTEDEQTHVRIFESFPDLPPRAFDVTTPCTAIEIADYDGDGDPELALGLDSHIKIYELDGTLRNVFRGTHAPGSDGIGQAMDSADVNGDGRMDLLAGAPLIGAIYLTLEAIP